MPHDTFEAIPRRKLRDGVLEQLLAAIERGAYRAGDELPSERELMATMRVGRPAVREAMIKLEQRGLIAIAHGRRARMCEPGIAGASAPAERVGRATSRILGRMVTSADDLKEARMLFETAMVRLASERATPAGIARLKRALADNRRAIPSARAFLATDMALHRTIAGLSGNVLCAAAGDALFGWLTQFRVRMVHVEGANLLSHHEHARIVERIAAHDPAGATSALEAHLDRSHSLYQRLAARRPQPALPIAAPADKSHARRQAQ